MAGLAFQAFEALRAGGRGGRDRAGEALRQSEERFRAAFGSAALGMTLASPGGRFLQVNPSMCEITGYTAEELLATDFQSITTLTTWRRTSRASGGYCRGRSRTYTWINATSTRAGGPSGRA